MTGSVIQNTQRLFECNMRGECEMVISASLFNSTYSHLRFYSFYCITKSLFNFGDLSPHKK